MMRLGFSYAVAGLGRRSIDWPSDFRLLPPASRPIQLFTLPFSLALLSVAFLDLVIEGRAAVRWRRRAGGIYLWIAISLPQKVKRVAYHPT